MARAHDRAAEGAGSVLVPFARHPEPGRVKKRLARVLGDDAACALYAAFVADIRRRFADAPFAVRWAVAPPDRGFAERFAIDPAAVFPQRGDGLGARMHDALGAMARAGFARCAIVGTDMPQLAVATVADALARLDAADLVLGPAEDGGYYLIAARRPLDVFDGIAWGTSGVLAATLERAHARGLATSLLAPGFDIDVAEDLPRLRRLVATAQGSADMPATAAVLAAIV